MRFLDRFLINTLICFICSLIRSEVSVETTNWSQSSQESDRLDGSQMCSESKTCSQLNVDCIECHLNYSCIYGQTVNTTCKPLNHINCSVSKVLLHLLIHLIAFSISIFVYKYIINIFCLTTKMTNYLIIYLNWMKGRNKFHANLFLCILLSTARTIL
jgi:hypothetical protein